MIIRSQNVLNTFKTSVNISFLSSNDQPFLVVNIYYDLSLSYNDLCYDLTTNLLASKTNIIHSSMKLEIHHNFTLCLVR